MAYLVLRPLPATRLGLGLPLALRRLSRRTRRRQSIDPPLLLVLLRQDRRRRSSARNLHLLSVELIVNVLLMLLPRLLCVLGCGVFLIISSSL